MRTLAVHAGRDGLTDLGVHVPPIDLSTTAPLASIASGGEAYEALAQGLPVTDGMSSVYRRAWNPTVDRFERAIAAMEAADGPIEDPQGVAFASGMAAMSAVLLARAAEGRNHVVAVRPLYGGTDALLAAGLLGTTVTFCGPQEVGAAITESTGLVVLESPANPTLELRDIADVVRQAGDVPVLVDNTFATPVLQRPLRHGARYVLHSATKYIGGHGDAMGGVVVTDPDAAARLRPIRTITGGVLDPWSAYLLHRGLATLPVRIRTQQESAEQVAHALAADPRIARVHYPTLPGADPQGLIGRQMDGGGAMVSFELPGGFAACERVVADLHMVTHAVSLGGVDSLIQHPAALTHRPVADEARPSAGLLRVSIGLEDPADIVADLTAGLGRA